jgi:Na+/phosphate symporter
MDWLSDLQRYIVLGLGIAALGVEVYACVDCVRRRPDAFVAAGKRTKQFWMLVTGLAVLLGFVSLRSVGILAIVAIIAAGVYLADVKPALDQVMGRGKGRTDGPYGPW